MAEIKSSEIKKKKGVFLFPGVFKNKDFVQWLLHCEILNGK